MNATEQVPPVATHPMPLAAAEPSSTSLGGQGKSVWMAQMLQREAASGWWCVVVDWRDDLHGALTAGFGSFEGR